MAFKLTENHFDIFVDQPDPNRKRFNKVWRYIHPDTKDEFYIKAIDMDESIYMFGIRELDRYGNYKDTHDGTTTEMRIVLSIMNCWKFEE